MLVIIGIILAYLLGSIPTGYLVARANGVNIQQIGSGNIGATNVLRAVGRGAAAIVIIADPLKGMVAVWLAMLANLGGWGTVLCGLAAVLGNNFNIFLRLKGGKGIATSIGVFIALAPVSTSLGILMGVFTIVLCRYVSMGSMIGMSVTPLFLALHRPEFSVPKMCLSVTLLVLSVMRHRNNLERLAKGTERRIGERVDNTSTRESSTKQPSTPEAGSAAENLTAEGNAKVSPENSADVEQLI